MMEINPACLHVVMDTMLSKLNSLLRPIVEGGEPPLTPMLSEIHAATELAVWMTETIHSMNSRFLTERMATGAKHQQRVWPNVNVWDSFIRGVNGLCTPQIYDEGDYADAVKELEEERHKLLLAARTMRKTAPGATNIGQARKVYFLPNDSQRKIYKERVLYYYNNHILGRDVSHKELMAYWAAVYQAIASRVGLQNDTFHGKDFDDFVYGYCGIRYNASSNPVGRYKRIGEVRYECVPALWREDKTEADIDHKMITLFHEQLHTFLEILGTVNIIRNVRAIVPKSQIKS